MTLRRAPGPEPRFAGGSLPELRAIPTRSNRAIRGALARLDPLVSGIIAERRAHPTDGSDLLAMLMAARAAWYHARPASPALRWRASPAEGRCRRSREDMDK